MTPLILLAVAAFLVGLALLVDNGTLSRLFAIAGTVLAGVVLGAALLLQR